MSTNYLHHLTCNQLISILQHVKLGSEHLSEQLSPEEYASLLSLGSLSNNQFQKMKSDAPEKFGNVSIIVNTILTSVFGFWLGFNSFTDHSIISWGGLVIIIAALGFGFLTGYLSYILTHKQSRQACKKQQLCNVQKVLINIIIVSRQKKMEKLQGKILALLQSLNYIENDYDKSANRILQALSRIEIPTKDGPFSHLIEDALKNIKENVEKLNADNNVAVEDGEGFDACDFFLNNTLNNASYIKTLTKTEITPKQVTPTVDTWMKKYSLGILVGLLPTFLGSLASMFVFLNGIPMFFSAIDVHLGLPSMHTHIVKKSALIFAFLISFYFAFSHIYSNYRNFLREKQLEITVNKIHEDDHQMLIYLAKANYWAQIYEHLKLIKELNSYQKSRQTNPA